MINVSRFGDKKAVSIFLISAVLLLLTLPVHAQSPLNFANTVTYTSGGYTPLSIAAADVNGDGKPDLIVANICVSSGSCGNGTVSVLHPSKLDMWGLGKLYSFPS